MSCNSSFMSAGVMLPFTRLPLEFSLTRRKCTTLEILGTDTWTDSHVPLVVLSPYFLSALVISIGKLTGETGCIEIIGVWLLSSSLTGWIRSGMQAVAQSRREGG